MLKALTQHHEATGDARVIPFLARLLRKHLERDAAERPLQVLGPVPRGRPGSEHPLAATAAGPDDRWLLAWPS